MSHEEDASLLALSPLYKTPIAHPRVPTKQIKNKTTNPTHSPHEPIPPTFSICLLSGGHRLHILYGVPSVSVWFACVSPPVLEEQELVGTVWCPQKFSRVSAIVQKLGTVLVV